MFETFWPPYKSKLKYFKKINPEMAVPKLISVPQDYQIKPLKKYDRPYFSPVHDSWELDFVFAQSPTTRTILQEYLFAININTRYLVVFPTRDKSAVTVLNVLKELRKRFPVSDIRGDGEAGFNSFLVRQFCNTHNITHCWRDSKFTNHNRIVDSVIRTLRNAFAKDISGFGDKNKVLALVDLYNKTPHVAFHNEFSPEMIQYNPELEGAYIRQQTNKLREIINEQKASGLHNYKPGNVLMIHIDFSKTDMMFEKRRRNFNELAIFISYRGGNVVCELLQPFHKIRSVEIPIQHTKYVCASIGELSDDLKHYFRVK